MTDGKIKAVLVEKKGFKEEATARAIIALCYKNQPKVRIMADKGQYYIVRMIE